MNFGSPEEREFASSEGEKLAKENNALYMETSAKSGQNIDKVFQLIATEVTTKQRKG